MAMVGFEEARERAFWWCVRREEMAEERAGSWHGCLRGAGGSVSVVVVGFEEIEGLGGEELGVIFWRGREA